jgi:pimeloyl-ACP methyl ester carboxylesterase
VTADQSRSRGGMKDPVFTPRWLEPWLKTFPHAGVLRLPDVGHYLQEDAPETIIPALLRFLGSSG